MGGLRFSPHRPMFSRVQQRMTKTRLGLFSVTGLTIFIGGILFWGAFNTVMEMTNTLPFCISCHEMNDTVYQEYRHSNHYHNASGVQAACPDCHVPKQWIPKVIRKIQASAELYHWAMGSIDTPEKFEAKRAHLAQKVWHTMKKTDSRECRNCHNFTTMELESQGYFAQARHRSAQEQGKTCIDCHKGITHKLPQSPPASAADHTTTGIEYDPEYGEEINQTCAACHGEYGEGAPDGEYPRLAGLSRGYIIKQLRDFKSRSRLNIPMFPYTTERELPEEDLNVIATYLTQIKLPNKLPPITDENNFDALSRLEKSKLVVNIALLEGNRRTGKRLYERECSTCHAEDGYGKAADLIPQLAGQHSEYLRRQINKFRKGERLHADNPGDQAIFRLISDDEIQDILSYLSILDD